VTFQVEDEPLLVTSPDPDRGEVETVTACDYRTLLADPLSEDLDLTLDQRSKLSARARDLDDSCGTN
jgi:hypothetical protein